MGRGLRVGVFCLFIIFAVMLRAGAQQTPLSNNPNRAKIQQLRQDMQGLQQQLMPLRSQMRQLMTQVEAVRDQMRPILEKLRADHEQLRALRGEHGHYQPQASQGQGQHPSGVPANNVAH